MPAVTVPPRPNGLPIASTQSPTRDCAGIAEIHRRQRLVGLHLQQRDVAAFVAADDLGLQGGVVLQRDRNLVGALDDMVVGHDVAGGIDDEARPEALRAPLRPGCVVAAALPPWPPWLRFRKSLKNCSNGEPGGNIGISGPAPGPFFAVMVWRGGHVDHRRQQPGREIGETVGRRPGHGRMDQRNGTALPARRTHRAGRRGQRSNEAGA